MSRRIGRSLLLVLALPLLMRPAEAQPAAEFYKGATINLYIGFPAGGGYDIYSRLVARHLGRHIAGNPTIVAQNMVGAGGLQAANFIYGVAPKDGTAIGMILDSAAAEQLLGTPGISYVADKFTWIGRVSASVNVEAMWHTSGIASMEDVMTREAVVGGSGPTSPPVVYPRVLNAIAGTKFKVVTGYGGSPESCLAMEKGEVMGCMPAWSTVKSAKPQWLRDKLATLVIQWGATRHKELPDVPTMVEMGKNDEDRQVLALYASATEMGKSIVAPPGLPADRTAILRDGFAAMLRDPLLLDEVAKAQLDFDPLTGEKLQKLVGELSTVSPEVIARARAVHDVK